MWPFNVESTVTASRLAEERRKEGEARKAFLTSDEYSKTIVEGLSDGMLPEDFSRRAIHLEEDEEYVFPATHIVPPEEPVFGDKGEVGPVGPVGPKGIPGPRGCSDSGLGAMEKGYVNGSTFGVPNNDVIALHTLSVKTGVSTEVLIGILEEAVNEIPSVMLQEMRNNA